ncbi:hypothetical protein CpB0927 [Chlamydia pneumoniae TW-183]|uniref:Uncharacterized protein n=3 Tax=Chlamydia pneumoniae TaxID=83558 RepID=A0A0F7YSR1_CHLPN|nr:CT753 hypothetical protein [Chlamydia pneumoniae CWL029]AAP98856.1 hypothetical protein CpB0927 [Chlamydia pneumoniae TW-183]CRI33427.1 Uncharacterized protein BN1224_Wien1_A_09340 [Chlamydia pneumoniae]BAA99104.1 CT753 hypothetical protein [Chlamydia pneumoniae J138]CRI36290.1 Uncharacterized protein BN1224_CM1_A_09370 [Chlamydia pneumoniae]
MRNMEAKKIKELSKEAQLLKKLREKSRVLDEKNKRKAWVAKLVAMPESIREIEKEERVETPQLFQAIAEKILEEGV